MPSSSRRQNVPTPTDTSKTTVIPAPKPLRLQIDLALQGGGAHGAFTWGELDRLLDDDRFEIAGVSGASAGAMNAVVLASGLMADGRSGAQVALRQFWERVGANAPLSDLHAALPQPFASVAQQWWKLGVQPWIQPWQQMAQRWASRLSPYQFNPLNLNPLRDILRDTVDFDRVRACDKVLLFIAATEVRTGHLRLFREHELNADAVLASACLPLLFQAVQMDGEVYWDGGYAGNPSLMPLIQTSPADDLVLVQISYNPHKPGRPSHALHTYWVANLRLVLDVVVSPGKEHSAAKARPGLIGVLEKLGDQQRLRLGRFRSTLSGPSGLRGLGVLPERL